MREEHYQELVEVKNSRMYTLLQAVASCCKLLGTIGGCWGVLGAGRRNRLLVDAHVANTQESQKETYKFKYKKRLLWQGSDYLLFIMVFEPRTMTLSILRPEHYH